MWSVFAFATAMKLFSLLLIASLTALALGHGYIKNPAARNVCRKYGFDKCPREYTPDEKNCGGIGTQWDKNGGKCGVCGDRYDNPKPTLVYPGKFATGTITGIYKEGQLFELELHITVSHKGWSEFRVGDIGAPPITQAKLNHLLKLEDGTTRWMHPGKIGLYKIMLQLPAGLKCRHCVLQWWWRTGNSWGCDSDGCGMGHGPQEHFVNCADITIKPRSGPLPPTAAPPPPPTTGAPPPTPVTNKPPPPRPATTQAPPPTAAPGSCKAVNAWAGQANMDDWCNSNCAAGYCPDYMCSCL
ncbi:predicted protein [Nematostella vectensis]|uniref:Chitin-binding type-4 domain-containing protein n=1 Tax=Nematostella vectensis TaxID=45351 RepID=A7SA41_NEMVE|nr:uncharacterized protein LOC5511034 [Nematostella vectensis]EDO39394.1 predicted protein [Nematostella vectensis]|eukprot:XP_001631457.1 predicted protein [Nematostella vectensis]